MEQKPDLSNIDTLEYPKNATKTGQVTNWYKATRAEVFELEEGEEAEYGDRDDDILVIEAVVEHEGSEIEVSDTMAYYDEPSTRSAMGKFLNRYDDVEEDMDIDFTFDDDGNAKIVGIRG